MSKLVVALTSIVALGFATEAWTGCCNTCPPAQTVVIACDRDGGADDALVEDPFEADHSEEALGLSSPCARACKKLSEFGCPESKKPPYGRTCIETCKKIAKISSYDPECVAAAKTIEGVRYCPAVKCVK